MSRGDAHFGDNHSLYPRLLEELISRSKDGVFLTEDDFAAHQSSRQKTSKETNPEFKFGAFQKVKTFLLFISFFFL